MSETFADVFARLRAILAPYGETLVVTRDEPDHYALDTHHTMKNGKPLFFASTVIAKNYVSFHLMPVYVRPTLLKEIPPALDKRRQGKSCFNFKEIDEDRFRELAALTRRGFTAYQEDGYIGTES